MHHYYDVTAFMSRPVSVNSNPITRITPYLNPLIRAININAWLPKFVIMILEPKFINHCWDHTDRAIRWIFIEFWKAIEAKHESLATRSKREYKTTVIFTNPLLVSDWNGPHKVYTDYKRRITKAMAKHD